MKTRRMQTFWLTVDEEAIFVAACKARDITKAEALREMALTMLSTVEPHES